MTSWTARIDALLRDAPNPGDGEPAQYYYRLNYWNERRLALAAERLKEPHAGSCTIGCWDKGLDDRTMACTCGKDSDMARILEGR